MAEIYSLRPSEHEAVQQLLPWFVNGTLSGDETARVDAHLGECAECREDLAAERLLAREVALLPLDVEEGWAGMATQLAAGHEDQGGRGPATGRKVSTGWVLGGAIAASLVLAVTLGGRQGFFSPEPEFHTLGSPSAASRGQAIVLFRPDATAQQMQTILAAQRAKVVDGPTGAGAYVLRFDRDAAGAIAALRRSERVVLAEPLAGDGRP